MTLRLRLVLALVVLLTAGLVLFGLSTYSLYARNQYQRLDDDVRASVPFVTRQVVEAAGLASSPRPSSGQTPDSGGSGHDTGGGSPPPEAPVSTYGELRDSAGLVVSHVQLSTSTAQPRLAKTLAVGARPRLFNTGSVSGAGSWRVYVSAAGPPAPHGDTVVIALPSTGISSSLHRLVFIEVSGAALLLAVLCLGAWLILRRGLRPIERMAVTAGSISAGDLSQRVSPSGGPGEIGQLGLALNTMLDEIEASFAEREATEQRLRQFLADASHELRTPLTSIQGFAELFRIENDGGGAGLNSEIDLPTILRRIEEEAGRMKGLVEDLLLLARLDQTRPIERRPVDLAVLAADACTDAVAAAPGRAITLDAPKPVVVSGDESHLRQAIANLVANAVRHTPDGSAIDVGARLQDGQATVSVRDHGGGLEPTTLEHAFDRFWQADRARSGPGAGLGLSIVAAIAAEHGGSAEAGNADGGGAVFTLRMSLRPAGLELTP